MYSDVSDGEIICDKRERYDSRTYHRNPYQARDFGWKSNKSMHNQPAVRYESHHMYKRERNIKIQNHEYPGKHREIISHYSRDFKDEKISRKHHKSKRSRSRDYEAPDEQSSPKKHRESYRRQPKQYQIKEKKSKSKRSHSDSSDSEDTKVKRHRHKHKHSKSSHDHKVKKHKHKSTHKKKKRERRSRSRSGSNSLKSTSFIDEILHNETAQDVIKKDETILKDVITTIENDKCDANNNVDNSFTPPLPIEVTKSIEDQQPEDSEKILNEIEQQITEKSRLKKLSVLDLPMPPLDINLNEVSTPEVETLIAEEKVQEVRVDHSYIKVNEENHSHNVEKKTQAIKPIILPSAPLITHRKRPIIIGKEEVKKADFKNREMKKFTILEQVGEGTYGKVYKAIDTEDKRMVAMKMIRMENEHQGFPITCLREIKNLQLLDHPNIIKLHDVTFDSQNRTYLVFEFMNHDLLGLMNNGQMKFNENNIFQIISQVLEGLKFCHERSIIHRDLKSSNILLHNNGSVKLADFGLSRAWVPKRPYTNKVISLWYRPIELLLGEEQYTPSVDIWSVGCIMTELFKRSPLFPFSDEFDVVDAIYKLCGTPNNNFWPEAVKLPRYKTLSHKTSRPRVLRDVFSSFMPPVALELVDKMLTLNPNRRISAKDALESIWITNMKKKNLNGLVLPQNDSFEYRVKLNRKRKDT